MITTAGGTAIPGRVVPLRPYQQTGRYRGISMRTCSIPGCENKHKTKGYCHKHYLRFWKYGDPLYTPIGRDIECHGMEKTTEYKIWQSMKDRCYNKNCSKYHRYGGRGITVCDRWKNSFIAFFKDMGLKPFPKAQIDRIDNSLGYYKENCRWVTNAINCQNSSQAKLTMQKAENIRELYTTTKITQEEIGLLYGVARATIGSVVRKISWI